MKDNLFMSVFLSINTNTALKKLTSVLHFKKCLRISKYQNKIKKPNDLLIKKKNIWYLRETVFFNNSNLQL